MVCATACLAACAPEPLPEGTGPVDNPARMTSDGQPAQTSVIIPSSVAAGDTFSVIVRTWGPSSCRPTVELNTVIRGREVDIAVADHVEYPLICTDDIVLFDYPAALRFSQPGPVVVRVRGTFKHEARPVQADDTVMVH